jgi:hypothetical protein
MTERSTILTAGADWQCRVRALHDRHWAQQRRPQHGRSPLLRLLRRLTTRRGSAGPQVWHGRLGADVHAAVGAEYDAARLGEAAVAAVQPEDRHRVPGGYAAFTRSILSAC